MSRRRRAALLAGLAASLCACRTGPWERDESWSFAVTNSAWEEWESGCGKRLDFQEGEEYAALALVLLPLAIDLALLPVTLPHDLWLD